MRDRGGPHIDRIAAPRSPDAQPLRRDRRHHRPLHASRPRTPSGASHSPRPASIRADKLLRHKTTRRAVYEAARAEYPAAEADEVLLLNERGEACEGTITSVFLDDGSGILKTPPISCGLLAGVLRTELICHAAPACSA